MRHLTSRDQATGLVNNAAWLEGYDLYVKGHGCPWGDESARLGWITAKADAVEAGIRKAESDRQGGAYA